MVFCVSAYSWAQETSHIIPKDAIVVASLKGNNLLQLLSMDDLNTSFMGKEILQKLSNKHETVYTSLEDFGLNLNSSSHYFHQINDSISYNAFVFPIKEISKFEDFIVKQMSDEVISVNGVRTFKDKKKDAIVWNETTLVIVNGSMSSIYFDQEEVMERYGLTVDSYYYDDVAVAVEAPEDSYDYYEDSEDVVDAVAEPAEEAIATVAVGRWEDQEGEKIISEPSKPSEYDYNEEDNSDEEEDYYSEDYYDIYTANDSIKSELQNDWSLQRAMAIILQPENQSIITNKSYQSSLDKDAEATLWIRDFGVLSDNLLGNMSYALGGFNMTSMYDNTSLTAKLFTEKDRIQLSTAYTVNDQWAKSYKKITSRKLNSKLLKYVNEDRMVGYMSYAIDTKSALQEYPAMMKSMYGNMPLYGEEASLAIDLFELLLDEEAVAKVFPGDMLFLLSGISQKEVTYTTYEYDDNYDYVEVEETRTETVPDFLLMVSSEDSRLLKKLINYGAKRDFVVFENGFFSIKIPESPLDLHFIIKDGILFMGTSETEMHKIATSNYDAKLSKKHKKRMQNSNYSMFINGSQLASNIPMDGMSEKEMSKMNYFLTNATDAYISSSKIKGNVIAGEMIIEVPSKEQNSLTYLFKLIENLAK